ncbi:ML4, partial [Symbiodinium pilosum]
LTGRLVLRNTFIELEDEDVTADFPFGRARACSDSCLFDATTPKAPDDEASRADLNVSIELTGASCLNTPRSDEPDSPGTKGVPALPFTNTPLPLPELQVPRQTGQQTVSKDDLDRLSQEVSQLMSQNNLLRHQIVTGKEPEVNNMQEVGAVPWMAYVPVAGITGYVQEPLSPGRSEVAHGSAEWTENSTAADCGTSVMLRNLPNNYTRSKLLEMLDSEGFAGKYNFVYLPIDFHTQASLGYAFVNLVESSHVYQIQEKLTGFKKWKVPSKKVCEVRLCGPWPDLEAHVERYRNSSVMHPSVPEEFKPALFENGKQVPFPKPSKVPKPPQIRKLPAGPLAEEKQKDTNVLTPGLVQRNF